MSYLQTKLYATIQDKFHEWFCEQYTIHYFTIKRIMGWFFNELRIDDTPHSVWPVRARTQKQMEEIKERILTSLLVH